MLRDYLSRLLWGRPHLHTSIQTLLQPQESHSEKPKEQGPDLLPISIRSGDWGGCNDLNSEKTTKQQLTLLFLNWIPALLPKTVSTLV